MYLIDHNKVETLTTVFNSIIKFISVISWVSVISGLWNVAGGIQGLIQVNDIFHQVKLYRVHFVIGGNLSHNSSDQNWLHR